MFVSFLHLLVVVHFEIGTKKGVHANMLWRHGRQDSSCLSEILIPKKGVNLSDSGKHKFGKFEVLTMPFFGDQQV